MSPNRKVILPNDRGMLEGGVFVLRAWVGPDKEIVGRMQWSIDDEEEDHAYALGTNAIIRTVHSFLNLVDTYENATDDRP